MVNIFICHASPDSKLAKKLSDDFRDAGHYAKVDLNELRLGDDLIDFMNDGIGTSAFKIVLYSKHSVGATWQKLEINAAIWNEVAQQGGKVIVLTVDDVQVPPLLGPKVYCHIDTNDQQSYIKAFERLCKDILPSEPASSVIAKAFRKDGRNPFRRVRAEYFEHDPELLVKTFAPPEPLKLSSLHDLHPCFLEGSRGTGKSMLLLSMRARNYLTKRGENSPKLFGLYLKLTGGAGCNPGVAPGQDPPNLTPAELAMLIDISNQEFIVYVIESLLSEIHFCVNQNLLHCDNSHTKLLCNQIFKIVFGSTGTNSDTFEAVLDAMAQAHTDIAQYIRRRFIYQESPSVPLVSLDLAALKRVILKVREHIPEVQESLFALLLDEYENLPPYNQRVVNTIVKLAAPEFTVKVAKKLGTSDISGTTIGQELQETHDYARLTLVYDVGNAAQLSDYRALLQRMMQNVMSSEGFQASSATDVLPKSNKPEAEEQAITAELTKFAKAESDDQRSYYLEAATRRILIAQRQRKHYSGFDDLSFISSGVIRYFQEIIGVAFYVDDNVPTPPSRELVLSPQAQSDAVYLVSEHNLTALSRNVERVGEQLKYFVLDLGDLIKYKLLNHASEPEAGRITVDDPEHLNNSESLALAELLRIGVKEGALQTKEGRPAFRARHPSDAQPVEFNLCRIFAPVLEISPRYRWRLPLKTAELIMLANSDSRSDALRKLIKKIGGSLVDQNQLQLPINI